MDYLDSGSSISALAVYHYYRDSDAIRMRGLFAFLAAGALERALIRIGEPPERADEQRLFDGGDDRVDGRGFQEARGLPILACDFADGMYRTHLAGDSHDDQVGPLLMIGGA